MKIDAESIKKIIEEQVKNLNVSVELSEEGSVISSEDGIILVWGLKNAFLGEIVDFKDSISGMIISLEKEYVGVIVFGHVNQIIQGDMVKRTQHIAKVHVNPSLLGRVVDPVLNVLDGGSDIPRTKDDIEREIDILAPGVSDRKPVKESLFTGIKQVDCMVPIGKGQRELIIGDRQTGKTAIAIDTILNQKGKDVICVYVSIGQKQSSLLQIIKKFKQYGALDYTIVVKATAGDSVALQYIAPYVGTAIAEGFMWQKKHTLCVYDDLTKHAQSYRQISLLLKRTPAREAYPGDVFYLHSRLLERACKLSDENGGGSLTALPIVETQFGDVSAYIPTSIISITDGQIYLDSNLFFSGFRPAINIGLSVSRVGGNAQSKAIKQVAGRLRLDLAQFRELEDFVQFGSDLDAASTKRINQGYRTMEILKQDQYVSMSMAEQVVLLFVVSTGLLDDLQVSLIRTFESKFISFLNETHIDMLNVIGKGKILSDDMKDQISQITTDFISKNC